MTALRSLGWLVLVILLTACDSADQQNNEDSQRFYFIESLKLVESAGSALQNQPVDAGTLPQIFDQMDNGLKLAFQVRADYLDQFDPRLSKNYQRYFIKGVETYRLGIEAADAEQQKQGLHLLSLWATFWAEAGDKIIKNMEGG